jgi:hypothetical protein
MESDRDQANNSVKNQKEKAAKRNKSTTERLTKWKLHKELPKENKESPENKQNKEPSESRQSKNPPQVPQEHPNQEESLLGTQNEEPPRQNQRSPRKITKDKQ